MVWKIPEELRSELARIPVLEDLTFFETSCAQ
jgi:hypothetical protein